MRRFLALFKKEFHHIRRDPLSLGILVLVPVMLLILYGYALSFDVRNIRMAVLDEDRTQESRVFLDSVFQNSYFKRTADLSGEREVDAILDRGQARAVLRIPRGFAATVARGGSADVQVLVDGADANSANVTIGYLDALCDRATLAERLKMFAAASLPSTIPVVVPEPRLWFNPELDSSHFLVPGLIGLLLMISAVIATSLSIVREKERETIDQLNVSPARPLEIIMGKTLPYTVICLVTMTLVLALGRVLFGVTVEGSYALLALTTLVFLFAALGMGILISSITRSQQVAFQTAILTSLLPSIILSGFIFPIKNMPWFVQGITLVVIPRYFLSALRGIILKGAGLADVWPSLAALVVLGVIFNLLAMMNMRKAVS